MDKIRAKKRDVTSFDFKVKRGSIRNICSVIATS